MGRCGCPDWESVSAGGGDGGEHRGQGMHADWRPQLCPRPDPPVGLAGGTARWCFALMDVYSPPDPWQVGAMLLRG